jgi:hypothetical protein
MTTTQNNGRATMTSRRSKTAYSARHTLEMLSHWAFMSVPYLLRQVAEPATHLITALDLHSGAWHLQKPHSLFLETA